MAHIQIDDTTPRIAYTATADQVTFAVPFAFFDDSDLVVYVNGILKTLSDYEVTGAGENEGGSITFNDGLDADDSVVIVREIPVERTTDFPDAGGFNIPDLNTELDRIVAIQQQLGNDIERTFRLADSDTSENFDLPDAADRAGKFLAFDAEGDPMVSDGVPEIPVSPFMATLLDDEDTVTASTTLGIPFVVSVGAYGAIADGDTHPLSERYGTLVAAQAVYPFATSLNQEIDFCACKAASNAAFGEDGSEHGSDSDLKILNKELVIPGGSYQFGDDTWLIRNLSSGIIRGYGKRVTVLEGNGIVLGFDGLWYTTISNLAIHCLTEVGVVALDIDGNVPGQPYETRTVQGNTLQDLEINGGGSTFALAICRQGGGGAQGSENSYINCHLYAGATACYYQNGFNALSNSFFGGNFQAYSQHGIYVVGGTINVYGTGFQSTYGYEQYANGGYDIKVGDAGAGEICCIYGCRTESINFLYNVGGVGVDVRACRQRLAISEWEADTPYSSVADAGRAVQVLSPGASNESPYRVFVATTPGTSGGSEPTWPDDPNDTVVDGSVTWTYLLSDSILVYGNYFSSVDPNTVRMETGCFSVPPRRQTTLVSADYAVEPWIDTVIVDATAAPITITLPATPNNHRTVGREVYIKKADTSANAVTISASQNFAPGFNVFEGGANPIEIAGSSRGFVHLQFCPTLAGQYQWLILNQGVPA